MSWEMFFPTDCDAPNAKILPRLVGHLCHAIGHWGHGWHCNLWPRLPGQRLAASVTPGLVLCSPSCSLWLSLSPWLLHSPWTRANLATAHTAGRGHHHLLVTYLQTHNIEPSAHQHRTWRHSFAYSVHVSTLAFIGTKPRLQTSR